jgi:hypothetical protein
VTLLLAGAQVWNGRGPIRLVIRSRLRGHDIQNGSNSGADDHETTHKEMDSRGRWRLRRAKGLRDRADAKEHPERAESKAHVPVEAVGTVPVSGEPNRRSTSLMRSKGIAQGPPKMKRNNPRGPISSPLVPSVIRAAGQLTANRALSRRRTWLPRRS